MTAVVCIGETLEERNAGDTNVVCARQLGALLAYDMVTDWSDIVIAYEPVWAIGTGMSAKPEDVQLTHLRIRAWVAEHVSFETAASIRIVYGGSVNPQNA